MSLKIKQQQNLNLKNNMENIIHSIISTYYFAIAAIIFGIWKLRDTIKNTPTPNNTPNSSLQPFLSGIFASICSVVLGIIIYFKIQSKL